MITIPLTQGQVAVVDDEDAYLARFKWYAEKRERTYYATRNLPKRNGKNAGVVRLHVAVLGRPLPLFEIDHINGNGLDCRRSNLRLALHADNAANRRGSRSKTYTPFKGVYLDRRHDTWVAHIGRGRRLIWIGSFATDEEAARAYDAAAVKVFGQYARLNFPQDQAA